LALKKSLPAPTFREMNSTERTSKFGDVTAPLASGRLAVPWRTLAQGSVTYCPC
jgi:hypothetical protein